MRTTSVEVFEHETLRVGQALRTLDGRPAVLTERHFDALVRFNDAHGGRYFGVGHRRITATQYVGYVEVGDLALEILPKADRKRDDGDATAWRDALVEMVAIAEGLRLDAPTVASQRTRRSTVLELVAARFLDELSVLTREGLARGYREEESNSSTFRGRLVVAQQVRVNAARADRFYVRAQVYDRDVVVNQIVAAALDVLGGLALSPALSARAAAQRGDFADVGRLDLSRIAFDRLRLGRATLRYERALVLARLLLEHEAPQLRAGTHRVFALLFDMNVLWERYVAALFRRVAGAALRVSVQERHPFWSDAEHRRGLRPDIVVRTRADGRVMLIADTKWKVLGDGPPADADLQQMFAYNETLGSPRAVLLCPGPLHSAVVGRFVNRVHSCDVLHLSLVQGHAWRGAALARQVAEWLSSLPYGDSNAAATPT